MPERLKPGGNKLLINTLIEAAQSVKPDELLNIHICGQDGLTIGRHRLPKWWPDIVILTEDQRDKTVELLQGRNLGQLAREIGVSRVHLDKVRNGTRGFSDSMVQRILDHFGE